MSKELKTLEYFLEKYPKSVLEKWLSRAERAHEKRGNADTSESKANKLLRSYDEEKLTLLRKLCIKKLEKH